MITLTDADGTALETKVTMMMQCLENIKTYFALAEGARFGIRETREGKFVDTHGREASFRDLLSHALRDVGMIPLRRSFGASVLRDGRPCPRSDACWAIFRVAT
jgi:hypothetical protein